MDDARKIHLHEAFHDYTVSDLKDLCKRYEIRGISLMKKDELIQKLIDKVTDKDVFRQICFHATPEEMKTYEGAFRKHLLTDEECDTLCYWIQQGLCFIDQHNRVFVVEELKNLYHALNSKFWSEYHRFYDIYEYIEAAIHLYGVMPYDVAVSLFNRLYRQKITPEELQHFLDVIEGRPEVIDFDKDEEFIFDEVLLDVEQGYFAYEAVYASQGNLPYYLPNKEEFLRYANADYFEKNKEYQQLLKYLVDVLQVNHYIAEDMCEDIARSIRLGYQVNDILSDLDRKGIVMDPFHTDDLTELVLDMMNNTRIMFCKGFTLKEAGEEVIRVVEKKGLRRGNNRELNKEESAMVIPFPGKVRKQ